MSGSDGKGRSASKGGYQYQQVRAQTTMGSSGNKTRQSKTMTLKVNVQKSGRQPRSK